MTFVLVHGGGSTSRFWDRLLPHLDGPALAVDLPGRAGKPTDLATLTVSEEVASVLGDIEDAGIDEPMVIVAHSSGGLVAPGVVSGLGDRVSHIVLSAALVPLDGEGGIECMQPKHRDGLIRTLERARREGEVITLPGVPADPEQFRTAYGGDPLDDETLAFMVDPARCVPDTVHHYFQPVHWSTVTHVPVTYVINERDRPIPPGAQEDMVTRLQSPHVIRFDCGHVPAVTHSRRFATVLNTVHQ